MQHGWSSTKGHVQSCLHVEPHLREELQIPRIT